MNIRKKGSGGRRPGAGRPITMTLWEKIVLRLRASEVATSNSCTDAQALRLMERDGEIPPGADRSFRKYLVPSAIPAGIYNHLKQVPRREGILGAIPFPNKTRYRRLRNSNLKDGTDF
jgi:hypothetical protein